jgi:hypothetical protein
MHGDPLDRGFSLTCWPLVPLIPVQVAIALFGVNTNVAAILRSVADRPSES